MRITVWAGVVGVFWIVLNGNAQQGKHSEAKLDGFQGRIRSVLTTSTVHPIRWRQPDGVSLVTPVICLECEYDPAGERIRTGQTNASEFHGSNIAVTRGSQGEIVERRVLNASTGTLEVLEVFGPGGITKDEYYQDGKLTSSRTLQYDQKFRLIEIRSFDGIGSETEHWHNAYSDDTRTEEWAWDARGKVKSKWHYDPETKRETFESFDSLGQAKLRWTQQDDKMTTFWERSEEPNQYGACVGSYEFKDGIRETRCYSNGARLNAVIREFSSSGRPGALDRAEWRDGNGKLLYAAYYDHDFNSEGDWTRRAIRVVSPEIPERTLYEEDSRILTYW